MAELSAEQLEAQQQQVEEQVDEAGKEAGKEAQKQGATPEQVQEAVEKARKEEKDKLYPQIQALKDGMKELQDHIREEREEKERIKREAEEKAEKKRQAQLSDSEKLLEAVNQIGEQLKTEQSKREQLEQSISDRDKREELRRYREAQIQLAGDEIIQDLVTGDSKEEIDRAVQVAKARYAEFAERFKDEKGREVKRGMTSTSPDTEALEEEELQNALNFDEDKYKTDAVYRQHVQDELAHAYARQAGR